jgi:peptide/nickel transport system ATP-binding protein
MAARVAVMYVGKVVEIGPSQLLFTRPRHPYTAALLSAVPRADPGSRIKRLILAGEPASPASPPPGCTFHPRCAHATDICSREEPEWNEIEPGRFVRCHHAAQLTLPGNSMRSSS